jgi:hypothetical protein
MPCIVLPGIYLRRDIPATNGTELSHNVDKIRAEHLNRLIEKNEKFGTDKEDLRIRFSRRRV